MIFAAMWTKQGRQFKEIGEYHHRILYMKELLFPNEEYGFNGRRFVVSTNFVSKSYFPHSI